MAKADCESRCANVTDPGPQGVASISASVGAGGANRTRDVQIVQQLLNDVPPERGGPEPPLVVDGIAGPLTRGAISKFQRARLGFSDGRVDPDRQTLAALNAEAKSHPIARSPVEAQRLASAIGVTPDAAAAVQQAIGLTQRAIDFALIGRGGLTVDSRASDKVSTHFAMQALSREDALSSLRFIQTTYFRMRSALQGRISQVGGGLMFGASLHDIDPNPRSHDPRVKAFVARSPSDGIRTSRIYWSPGIDGHARDRFLYILMHECAHFVSEDDPSMHIGDKGYAFFGTVARLNHRERLVNADNYSMMAFDHAFGRGRLVALYPLLATWPA